MPWRIILTLAGLAAVAGCGSDSGSTKDSGVDAVAEAGTGTCTGTFAGLTRTQLGAVTSSAGHCSAASDLDQICTQDIAAKTRGCGQTCYLSNTSATEAQLVDCTSTCVNGQLPTPLSAACQSCYSAITACTIVHCIASCAVDPGAAACVQCQTQNDCWGAFYSCSGLPQPGGPADAGTD